VTGSSTQLSARLEVAHSLCRFLLTGAPAVFDLFSGREMIDLHAKLKPHLTKNFFDLVERLVAEILRLQHLLFGLLNQLTNVLDISVLKAVLRAHGKFQLIDAAEEIIVQWNRGSVFTFFLTGLVLKVHEDPNLVLENLRCIGHGVFWLDTTIGVNLKHQTIIIGPLAHASV